MIRKSALGKELRQKVLAMEPNERLPGVRELLSMYGAGRKTIDAILGELEADGLIERIPYVGIFCRHNHNIRKKTITYVTPDWKNDGYEAFAERFSALLADDPDFQFRSIVVVQEPFYCNLSKVPGDFLLLSVPATGPSLEDMAVLRQLTVPTLFLSCPHRAPDWHSIDSMPEYAGGLVATYFMERGHRKLAVLISEPHTLEIELRVRGFRNAARMRGMSVTVIDCKTMAYQSSMSRAYETLSTHLQRYGCDFSALFVVSDISALGALRALWENGLTVPSDVSVIGHDGLPQSEFFMPPLTSCWTHEEESCAKVVQGIRDYFSGKKTLIRIEQYPEIIERQSVCICQPNSSAKARSCPNDASPPPPGTKPNIYPNLPTKGNEKEPS